MILASNLAAGLDRRGNWLSQAVRFDTTSATMTRTVPTGGAGGTGGKANEYGRAQMLIGGQLIDHYLSYDAAGNLRQIDIVGDLNCDGAVDSSDAAALELLLADPSAYAAAYPDCQAMLGDVDGSGQLDEEDLKLFDSLIGLSSPRAVRFVYDAENRLSLAYSPTFAIRQEIVYDALGRRILSEGHDRLETGPTNDRLETGPAGADVGATRHYYDGLPTRGKRRLARLTAAVTT